MKPLLGFGDEQAQPHAKSNDHLEEFKFILSNQHVKQFHLIDKPELIFQLAEFKPNALNNKKNRKTTDQSSTRKKFYRHKSQQQLVFANSFYDKSAKNSENSKQNKPGLMKHKQSMSWVQEPFTLSKQQNLANQIEKIDFTSTYSSKQNKVIYLASSSKNQMKQNKMHKQNIQSKILSVQQRPVTSIGLNKGNNGTYQMKSNTKPLQSSTKWKRALQRKKYLQLKTKLSTLLQTIQTCPQLNFSQVYQYQQSILHSSLSQLVTSLKQQCIQKGQLIETIFNSFFTLIEKILSTLLTKNKQMQRKELQTQLTLHSQYQQMYQVQAIKIKELGKKYNQSKNVIDRLVYELRYKRKEVKKLYKSLAICNEKLNEYKVEHIDLQNQHIDLLIETHQLNKDQAIQALKRKIQVNKQKYLRLRVGPNKQRLKQTIQQQLLQQQLQPQEEQQFKKQLFQKLSTFSKHPKKPLSSLQQKQHSHVIEQYIEKYSNKYIPDPVVQQIEMSKTFRRPNRATTAVNTDLEYKVKNETTYSVTQTTFSDKLEYCLINNRSTQTPGAQKIKKTFDVEIQVDGDHLKIMMLKAKMTVNKTVDQSFLFDMKRRDERLKPTLQPRRSEYSFKKEYKNNNSISELSSDGSQSEVKSSKKRFSKNLHQLKKQKKTSIFNSTQPSFLRPPSQSSNPRTSKVHKKRTSEMPELSFQRQQRPYQQLPNSKMQPKFNKKQRNLLTPDAKSMNRPSLCISGVDSAADVISMNEQKQRYIENFIMNKDQEFQVLSNNSIFDAFKDVIMNKNNQRKSAFFMNYGKHSVNIHSQIIEANNQHDNLSQESQNDILDPKGKCSKNNLKDSNEQNQQNQSSTHLVKRKDKKLHTFQSPATRSNINKDQNNLLKQTHFLNKIIEFTVKKSLIKKKVDASNINACKQKSQLQSITEKLDPFMLDIEFLINQNFTKKRKPNQINLKSAKKFIMMTYSRSIDKMYRNNVLLQNLIKPLFQSFQVIYGALKPQDIYKKMVSFISDIVSVKDNQNFKEFVFFLGLDKANVNSAYLTTFDVCLYLKLLERFNLGGKMGEGIEGVWTSRGKVSGELVGVLRGQNISGEVIRLIEVKIKDLLEKLQDFVRLSLSSEQQSKINLFKVSRMIVEQVIKIRISSLSKLQSFISSPKQQQTSLKQIQKLKNQEIDSEPILKIIDCCRISTVKKLYFAKCIEELYRDVKKDSQKSKTQKKMVKRSEVGMLLVRIGLVEFDDLQQRISIIQQNSLRQFRPSVASSKSSPQKTQRLQQSINKLFLLQHQTNTVIHDLLGQIITVYEIGLIKSIQTKNK